MISKLNGRIDTIGDNWAIIDVQGVGYKALCSKQTLANMGEKGEFVSLYTEMVVRQDLIQLYGFYDPHERDWFNLLTTVQGVLKDLAFDLVEQDHEPSNLSDCPWIQ